MRTPFLFTWLTVGILLGALASCNQGEEKSQQTTAEEAPVEASEAPEEPADEVQSKFAARRAKGDTIALPYKELQAYLPAEVSGYQKVGDADGSMINIEGAAYSSCSQKYQMGPTDNPKNLTISIIDYNGAPDLYGGATSVIGANFSMEDDKQRIQSIDLGVKGVSASENFEKNNHRVTITAGVADRFFIVVEADQQDDSDFVKKAIEQLDLKKLAAI